MTINSTTVTNISLLCVGKDAGFNQRVKSLRGRKNNMSQNESKEAGLNGT